MVSFSLSSSGLILFLLVSFNEHIVLQKPTNKIDTNHLPICFRLLFYIYNINETQGSVVNLL